MAPVDCGFYAGSEVSRLSDMIVSAPYLARIPLGDADATSRLGQALAQLVRPGDTLLLHGDIGAGKSHLARALIQNVVTQWGGVPEEVPSPTFTLVQSYDTLRGEIWHADLYRLTMSSEIEELGLSAAFGQALCLVEWPDRLGPEAPADALHIMLSPMGESNESRLALLSATRARWQPVLDELTKIGPV